MRRLVNALIVAAAVSALLTAAAHTCVAQTAQTPAATSGDTLSAAQAKTIIEGRAREVLLALKARNMQRLSTFAHPQKGVRFSPYVYVDSASDRKLSSSQIRTFYSNNRRYTWGEYDGSGETIRLTFKQYLNRFVYSRDFLKSTDVGYNTKATRGNTANNAFDVYPRAIFVDYYLPDLADPTGMNWRSLWLVFEKQNQTWYLVAVMNDEWTI